ncbi:MAG TPA: 2-phospho-L-lactate transferase CofD family protein [Vicinamibacterales bacterium]|nr:2-phospho-L-lactate transferase CofD family protein [Vicinamibacterales bacterium]
MVLFSGGRGSGVLSRQLIGHADVALTIAINGYDDGASTGEVRRFLGDSLGPSDFRKNASRVARETRSCPESIVELFDTRLPNPCSRERALQALAGVSMEGGPQMQLRIDAVTRELATGRPFEFSDCAIGNLVFAGCYLYRGRRFNDAVDDYCGLLGLPAGLIDNVTDGTNAFLVALERDRGVLVSEAEIVDAKQKNRISDVFLLDAPLSEADRAALGRLTQEQCATWLEQRSRPMPLNPRLRERIAAADLIIYAPGTQHSSLFPSYLTKDLSRAIASNLTAIKLLVTNIQADAEISGSTAVDIVERAVFYLKEKGKLPLPVPTLITHYIINDPKILETDADAGYVPLGHLETLEDPRLVRIGHYEDGVSGRHDASKVLTPFLQSFLSQRRRQRIAVWLYDAASLNKLSQSVLEMLRGGIQDLAVDVTVFYTADVDLDDVFMQPLPIGLRNLRGAAEPPGTAFVRALAEREFDYAAIFESSGMYRGEDLVSLIPPLMSGRIDGVWGSRRLSLKDIEASYRLRYNHKALLGSFSYLGSHVLSAAYLLLFGRYISDTLSGVRAVRAGFLARLPVPPDDKLANQYLLCALLREKADLLETPVQFLPLSPERVRRTTLGEGLRSLAIIAWQRITRPSPAIPAGPESADLKVSPRAHS